MIAIEVLATDGTHVAGRWPWLAIAVGLVGLVVTASVAAAGSPSSAEVAVFRWFNDPPGALGAVTGLINPLLRPVGLTLLIVAVVVLLSLTRRDVFWPLVTAASAAGTLAYLVDNVVKLIVDRGRPPAYLSDVLFHGYPTDPRGTGYPSSHTAVTVAIVVGAWPWLNRPWRVGGVVAAAAIGLNRMYVGAHFPLDILGGVSVGLVAGGIVLVVAQRVETDTPHDRMTPGGLSGATRSRNDRKGHSVDRVELDIPAGADTCGRAPADNIKEALAAGLEVRDDSVGVEPTKPTPRPPDT